MSASATPATPLTVWPVLFRPQRSVKRVSFGVAVAWRMLLRWANSTSGWLCSRRITAASLPAATRTTSVLGSRRARSNVAPLCRVAAPRSVADAPGSNRTITSPGDGRLLRQRARRDREEQRQEHGRDENVTTGRHGASS